jgi:hypothetical protein
MSPSDPLSPLPYHFPEDIDGDLGLQIGPADGPDVLEEADDTEPELDSVVLNQHIPLRRPTVGDRLTAEQLEAESESASDAGEDADVHE